MSASKKSKKHDKKSESKKKKHAKQPDGKSKKSSGPDRDAKPKKRAALQGRSCPCCKKCCPLAAPKCSKGKAVRKKLLRDAGAA